MGGPMPSLVSGYNSSTAAASRWAVEWRYTSSASGSLLVRSCSVASASTGRLLPSGRVISMLLIGKFQRNTGGLCGANATPVRADAYTGHMATLVGVPVEEYLRTYYEPDAEY